MRSQSLVLSVYLALVLLAGCGSSGSGTTSSGSDVADFAQVLAYSAGEMGQAGTVSDPTLFSADEAVAPSVVPKGLSFKQSGIEGFTFGDDGVWTGTTQYGATPSLTFYLADDTLIAVDVTDETNYQAGGDLFELTPPGRDGTTIQIQIDVAVEKTLSGGYTMTADVSTGKVVATPANTNADASHTYTGSSGTVTGSFGTINFSSITFDASEQGAVVDGSYNFTATYDGATYTGTAQFDENGCKGATILDSDGNTVGTAQINDDGDLIFTDADGNATALEKI